tara:strand:- start:85 stop:636 length:552 start_codon:yes stop_codon:yes gene_type:complete
MLFIGIAADTPVEEDIHVIEIFSLFLLPFFLFCLYSLYKIRPIGKKLFLPLVVISHMFGVAFGQDYDYEVSNLDDWFTYFDGFFVGIIFTSLYFTDISKDFEMVLPETNGRKEINKNKDSVKVEYKNMSVLLIIGIFFLPFIFSWFTLKKDANENYIYRKPARIISFVWLFFGVTNLILRSVS